MTTRTAASLALAATATLVASASTAHADDAVPAARLDLRAPAVIASEPTPADGPSAGALGAPPSSTDPGLPPGYKDPATARGRAISGALLGPFVALGAGLGVHRALEGGNRDLAVAAGLTTFMAIGGISPSLGHIYAGEVGHAAVVSGVRIVAATTGVLLLDKNVPASMAVLGGAAALTIYDLIDAPRAARRHNARLATRQLTVSPMPVQGGGGMAVGGSF